MRLTGKLTAIVLHDADGNEVRLGSLWQSRRVVLAFVRHFG